MRLRSEYREQIGFRGRVARVGVGFAAGFVLLLLQLVRLQVVQGGEFQRQSRSNSIRLLRLPAPRGLITDIHGTPLVDNRPAFTIDLIPGEAPSVEPALARLAEFTELDVAAATREIAERELPAFAVHRVKEDLTLAEILPIEEHHLSLPGVLVSAEPQRRVIHGPLAAHVLGTVGEIDAEELVARAELGYRMGDLVGKSGVEAVGETTLRGADGALQVEVYADAPQSQLRMITREGREAVNRDFLGRQVRTLGRRSALPGDTMVLTLDLTLQQVARDALGDRRGAVVVLDARTGAIRAMVSQPSFNPNAFVRPAFADERVAALTDPAHPMVNRAVKAYAPGSTVKMLGMYAGLHSGTFLPTTTQYCPGYFSLGRRYHCWKSGGHGRLDLVQALAYSCDTYFFALGHELGIGPIEQTFRDFGLGARTGFDLPGESPGLVPGPNWKATRRHLTDRRWYAGETMNVVIGQGQVLASPLQLACMLAPFVNGGYLPRPYVIERAESPDGTVLYRTAPDLHRVHGWNAEAGAWVVEGLREAFRARKPFYGTAWRAKLDHLDFIGKTGTAQVVKLLDASRRRKTEDMPLAERDHAWFVGSVLDREPRLVMAVFVEHGGHASESAVPIVNDFFNTIFPADQPASEAPSLARAEATATPTPLSRL